MGNMEWQAENSELASDKELERTTVVHIWTDSTCFTDLKSGEKLEQGLPKKQLGGGLRSSKKTECHTWFNQFIPDWKPYEMIQALLTMEVIT